MFYTTINGILFKILKIIYLKSGALIMNSFKNKKLLKLEKITIYFFMSFIPLELIGRLLQPLFINPALENIKINLRLFSINIIGFLIPLVVTILLLLYIVFKQKTSVRRINLTSLIAWLLITFLWLFIIVLSLNYKLIIIDSIGGGTSIPIFILVLSVLFYYIYKEKYKQALPLSYIMGFLLGVSSDFISTFGIFRLSSGIWGGYSFLDGDFYTPLVLVAFVLITEKLENKHSIKNENILNS